MCAVQGSAPRSSLFLSDVDTFAQFFLNLSQYRARDLLPVLAVPPFLVRAGALP